MVKKNKVKQKHLGKFAFIMLIFILLILSLIAGYIYYKSKPKFSPGGVVDIIVTDAGDSRPLSDMYVDIEKYNPDGSWSLVLLPSEGYQTNEGGHLVLYLDPSITPHLDIGRYRISSVWSQVQGYSQGYPSQPIIPNYIEFRAEEGKVTSVPFSAHLDKPVRKITLGFRYKSCARLPGYSVPVSGLAVSIRPGLQPYGLRLPRTNDAGEVTFTLNPNTLFGSEWRISIGSSLVGDNSILDMGSITVGQPVRLSYFVLNAVSPKKPIFCGTDVILSCTGCCEYSKCI